MASLFKCIHWLRCIAFYTICLQWNNQLDS
uniref:Uncharacterized protein n=1 Tax=Anguilla anguilla TaxID=7936 RepID=A0A0E9Q4G7_ANGAN